MAQASAYHSRTARMTAAMNRRVCGTVRTLDAGIRDLGQKRVEAIVTHTRAAYQFSAAIDYLRGDAITGNAEDGTLLAARAAGKVTPGLDHDTPPIMACEDFSYMLNKRPGAYMMNKVSAAGEVNDRLSIAMGSNSSNRINPVPTHASGTSSPMLAAITSVPAPMPDRTA